MSDEGVCKTALATPGMLVVDGISPIFYSSLFAKEKGVMNGLGLAQAESGLSEASKYS